ncbi:cytochrome P450 76T24-like [Arachis stenosperma]|uniref:cytochrome P450 76T24-like n=1 Tax=Arachis stenosperma TaxID=217475 RepID=UPI0025AC1A6A|nr:cytochrome P450 76T24-like [Arachis stenosperma]
MPPGPYPYPIIGNILELLSHKPYESLFHLSKTYGPIMSLKFGTLTAIVISSPEIAKEALTKHDLAFSNRQVLHITTALGHNKVSMVWSPVCDHWRTLRKLCSTNIFSPQRLESTSKLRHKNVQELVNFVGTCSTKGEAIDIGNVVFITIMNSLSNTLFSMDLAHYLLVLQKLIEGILDDAGKINIVDLLQGLRGRCEESFKRLLEVFNDIFEERMRLKVLSSDKSSGGTCYDVLARFFLGSSRSDLFIAGLETTTSTVEWAMAELVHNPKKMAKAKEELLQILGRDENPKESDISKLPYLEAIVKETFRLHTPIPILFHKSNSNVEINCFKVPKHAEVLVNLWAIGRNSSIWSNPNSFVPERFQEWKMDTKDNKFEFIPFGVGRRMCPAISLVHRIVPLILATLLHCFDWKIADEKKPQELDMREEYGLTVRRAQPLLLIPISTN